MALAIAHYFWTMNSNLVPTQIVNRNGVRTTVYRKAGSAIPSAPATIPPASLKVSGVVSKYLSGMDNLAASPTLVGQRLRLVMERVKINKKMKTEMLTGLHDDTLTAIHESVLGPESGVQHYLIDSCMRQRTLVPLNNAAVVADVAAECNEANLGVFHAYVDGLQMYRQHTDPLIDWSTRDDTEREIPKALIRAAIGLKRPYSHVNTWVEGKPRHIASRELADLVMKRPHDVQRIIDLINQRDLPVATEEDIAALEGLLNQETENALISGLL